MSSSVSAFSRIITFTRCDSWALNSDWHSVMPRCAPVMITSISASTSTQTITGVEIGVATGGVRLAGRATTLSTMRAPTQATADGSTPASSVTKPRNRASFGLVAHTSSRARLL